VLSGATEGVQLIAAALCGSVRETFRPLSRRRLGVGLCAIGLTAGVLSGCGSDTKVDRLNLQTAIATSIAQQQHKLAVVSCPGNIKAKKGVTFSCVATLANGRQVPITVTGKDDKGNVHYAGFRGLGTTGKSNKPHP
jgi:uncharacterized protein DUF4333